MQIKVKGILSFPHLFQPRIVKQGDDPKYSATVLIRKDDPQLAQIQQAIETEKQNGFPSGFPHSGKVCLKDGAVVHPNDPAMHGYMVISVSAKQDQRPHVVDMTLNPVMNPGDVFAGAVCWFALNTFSYNLTTSKGVGCGLNGVMVTGEVGELGRLDGRPSVDQMFSDVAGGGVPQQPAPAAPAPAANLAPPPAAAAPQPPTPPAAPPAQPQFQMTAAAQGHTREQYHAAGWSDEQLINAGMMLPPNGVAPSFS